MRITLIALHFAEYSCRLAVALAQYHDVQLILSAPNVAAELEDEFDVLKSHSRLTIILLPHRRSPILFLQNTVRLIAEINRFNPDVIHAQEVTKDYLVLSLLMLRSRYPVVITVHDPQPHSGQEAQEMKWSRHRLYHRLFRYLPTHAITHGQILCEQLLMQAPHLTGRVTIIPHGYLGPVRTTTQEAEAGTLLFFGRINAYKGLRYFIEATLLLRARGLKVKSIIAGRGEDLAPNRAVIDANDCFELHEEYVSRGKLSELFGRAQLVVMPYTDATQSGVAAMAIGFGRPMVATRVGSIPEMVKDGETGLLVSPKDAIALADAIAILLNNPILYAELVSNVRADCAGWLGWSSIADTSVNVYLEAIAYKQRGSKRIGLTKAPAHRERD